jgi:beta-glucosidase
MSIDEVDGCVDPILRSLKLREKITLLSGGDHYRTASIARSLPGAEGGLSAMILADGPHSVHRDQPGLGKSTVFPTGLSMASTWNPALIEQVGQALGEEARALGADILLGPCVNIIRTPHAGVQF